MENDLIRRSALLERIDGIWDCNNMIFEGERDHSCKPEDCKGCHWHDTKQYIRKQVVNAPAVDAVVLPCKVGDTVWGIRNYKGINHPQQGKVDQMYYTNDMRLHIKIKHICIGEWGKKIFPTREEAEAALKRKADK